MTSSSLRCRLRQFLWRQPLLSTLSQTTATHGWPQPISEYLTEHRLQSWRDPSHPPCLWSYQPCPMRHLWISPRPRPVRSYRRLPHRWRHYSDWRPVDHNIPVVSSSKTEPATSLLVTWPTAGGAIWRTYSRLSSISAGAGTPWCSRRRSPSAGSGSPWCGGR